MSHHHDEHAGHHHEQPRRALHQDWRAWAVVGLMLVGMVVYIMSNDESDQPGGREAPPVPAATGP
jgi:hypothetical protein